jgi:outer membrane protein OmpA-like peptidoglycan-associated protein
VKKEGHSFDTKMITKKEIEKIKAFVTGEKKEHKKEGAVIAKHTNHKDTNQLALNHKDYLHSKAAATHHLTTTEKPTDKLEVVPQETKKEEENSMLDGAAMQTPVDTLLEERENSILDGVPATSLVIRSVNMDVSPLKEGMTYAIKNILFATNSSILTEQSKFIIKEFSKFMLENKNIDIVIQGHTDDLGDAAKNIILSEERSKAVKEYLISLGVEANRLEAKGFGAKLPKVLNDSEQNRAINRRTDFLISKIR